MIKLLNSVFVSMGYDDASNFIESAFHPKTMGFTITASSFLATLAAYFEKTIGLDPVVGIIMYVLFFVELSTGIAASKKEGGEFKSKKLGRGFFKMLVYMTMIGSAHLLAKNVDVKPTFGLEINYYEWLHYAFFNFVILNLFISNIENFARLGWGEFKPLLTKLKSWTTIKKEKETSE